MCQIVDGAGQTKLAFLFRELLVFWIILVPVPNISTVIIAMRSQAVHGVHKDKRVNQLNTPLATFWLTLVPLAQIIRLVSIVRFKLTANGVSLQVTNLARRIPIAAKTTELFLVTAFAKRTRIVTVAQDKQGVDGVPTNKFATD